MSDGADDPLWDHFAPLWKDLTAVSPGLLLAGGYALFLKQSWLADEKDIPTVVSIDQWSSNRPRVTKDFDFIASLDLIASADEQLCLHEVLEKHRFDVVPQNARWQFQKNAGENRVVLLDFHAAPPAVPRSDLRVDARRIKPGKSLAMRGIHARENPEACGSELHPFSFCCQGLEIVLPNPVTLVVMKLVAMRDRWLSSQDESKSAVKRAEEAREAMKHASDVWRTVAMVTRAEGDTAPEVIEGIRHSQAFHDACEIFAQYFESSNAWGFQADSGLWQEEHRQLIQKILTDWLR